MAIRNAGENDQTIETRYQKEERTYHVGVKG